MILSDAATVRAWDFSEANEVQERLDALRATREAQRAQRRERGGRAGRKSPRFPPPSDSVSGSGDEEEISEPCAPQCSAEPADACRRSSSVPVVRAGHACPWEEGSRGSGEWRDLEASGGSEQGSRARYHCHSISLQPGCSERYAHEAGSSSCSSSQLSQSLPGAFPRGSLEAASLGRSPPMCAHVPPPVLRSASVSAERGRSRMTSWDILRPRTVLDKEQKGGGDSIKVAG